MKKELNITNISKAASLSHFLPFEQNKKAELLNCSSAFYVHREQSTQIFHSDYIEQKTTLGGKPIELIYDTNSFYYYVTKCMQCFSSNITTSYFNSKCSKTNITSSSLFYV
jgi:hypothetical protein